MSHDQYNDAVQQDNDPEVVPKAKRRRFSAKYKRRILNEHEACTEPGEKGSFLRQEGLYSSHITNWHRQRERGKLDGLKRKKANKSHKNSLRIALFLLVFLVCQAFFRPCPLLRANPALLATEFFQWSHCKF